MNIKKFKGLVDKIKSELTQYQYNNTIANVQIFHNILDYNKRLSVDYYVANNIITITKYILIDGKVVNTHYTTYVLTDTQYKTVKELFNA